MIELLACPADGGSCSQWLIAAGGGVGLIAGVAMTWQYCKAWVCGVLPRRRKVV